MVSCCAHHLTAFERILYLEIRALLIIIQYLDVFCWLNLLWSHFMATGFFNLCFSKNTILDKYSETCPERKLISHRIFFHCTQDSARVRLRSFGLLRPGAKITCPLQTNFNMASRLTQCPPRSDFTVYHEQPHKTVRYEQILIWHPPSTVQVKRQVSLGEYLCC